MFQRTVQGCWPLTPFTSVPFTSPTVRHRVPSGSERAVPIYFYKELPYVTVTGDWKFGIATRYGRDIQCYPDSV